MARTVFSSGWHEIAPSNDCTHYGKPVSFGDPSQLPLPLRSMRRKRVKIEAMTNSVTRSRMNFYRSSSMQDFAGHGLSARTTVACSSHPAVAGFTSKSTT